LPGDKGVVKYRYAVFSGGVFSRWESSSNIVVMNGSSSSGEGGGDAGSNAFSSSSSFFRDLTPQRSDKVLLATADVLDITAEELGQQTLQVPVPSVSPKRTSHASISTSTEVKSFKARQLAAWGRRSKADNNINQHDGVVIVSYILPVLLKKSSSGDWSAEWDNENLLSLQLDATGRITWVGSVRYQGAPIPAEDEEAVAEVLAKMSCYPVFISQSMHFQFYDVFCKTNLWLLLHHVADVYGPLNTADIGAKGQQDLWFTYSTVNRLFRDKVVEVFHKGDLVWIHGFHLMLLPSFLRRSLTMAKIGFFFHTPFPSSEIWRTMNRREDLLRGILSADQIGFHLFEYARHFLTTCQRLLGHGHEMNANGTLAINVDGREVAITCIHVGIDLPRLQIALSAPAFATDVAAWRQRFPNKTIVAGIDRLERLKGIPLKLIAIDEFMQENPKWRGKLLFSIIGISAPERGSDYRQTQRDVRIMVEQLNAKYANGPGDILVHFEERMEREMRLQQRLAFFGGSDILMITATRDGLNRFPMEFTLARQRAGQLSGSMAVRTEGAGKKADQGLVIISEFISSARVMRGALTVNPWRTDEVKLALVTALEMGEKQRADR